MERGAIYGESKFSVLARRQLLRTGGLILSALFRDRIEIPRGNMLNLLQDNKPLSDYYSLFEGEATVLLWTAPNRWFLPYEYTQTCLSDAAFLQLVVRQPIKEVLCVCISQKYKVWDNERDLSPHDCLAGILSQHVNIFCSRSWHESCTK